MAPALTEPISHRQSKISSPAQASSPRPIISDVTDQTQTTTATATATNPHHRLAAQQNGGGVGVENNYNTNAKDSVLHAAVNQIENLNEQPESQPQQQLLQQQPYQTSKKSSQFKNNQHQFITNTSGYQAIFVQQLQNSSNGPSIGPSFETHMDQQNNDQSIVTDQQYQQHQQNDVQAANDLLIAIVDGTQSNNQLDCGINAMDSNIEATVEQLLAETNNPDLQQLQQELLQQQSHDQSHHHHQHHHHHHHHQHHQDDHDHQLDQQLNFALQQEHYQAHQDSQYQNAQSTMDLLMSDQTQHQSGSSGVNSVGGGGGGGTRNDDGTSSLTAVNSMTSCQSTMSNQMQSEMDQMLDIDFMQVLKCFESAPAGENLGDLAGGLSLFNDMDVMNIGLEDVVPTGSQSRESRAQEMMADIEKKRAQMTRECDFMMRRLRKIQARHMGRHVSEEVGGIYEYAQQLIKRKERETKSISTMTSLNQLHSDKHKLNSASSWRMLLKRIEHAAMNQHSNTANSKLLQTGGINSSTSMAMDQHYANNSGYSMLSTASASSPTLTGGSAAAIATGTSGSSMSAAKPAVVTCVPQFDQNGIQQLQQCAGLLSSELKLVGNSFDSDATESSSGGESADENTTYNNPHQQPLSIAKRSAYRWARDRAKIASRWTWLLAQISDLEYRIRQHQELYILLKKSNGQVTFEDIEPVASTSDGGSQQPSPQQQQQQQSSVNGYRGTLPGNMRFSEIDTDTNAKLYGTTNDVELNGSARTRAFKASAFKKRKLLQSTNLHKISRRAARPCTIKCGCRWPVHPCLLCTGRTDPTAPRDLPDMMSTQESVALLDPCYHPILSFPEDVSQNIYMEATLRQPEWQQRVARTSTKAIIKGALAMQKANERDEQQRAAAAAHSAATATPTSNTGIAGRKNSDASHATINSKKMSPKKFKLTKKLKKSQNNTTTTTINNRKPKKSASHTSKVAKKNTKPRKNSHMSATSSDHHDMDVGSPNGSISRSKNPSPIPGHSYRYERLHSERRHNKNAYDIDNIVIPSIVSSRVEILSYKEIPTPKWRVIKDDDVTENTTSQNESVEESKSEDTANAAPTETPTADATAPPEEDISNEAYAQRHDRALAEERKKFTTFLKFPYSTRSRANRRIDSQSSGANTPDPMSPAPGTPAPATNIDQESAPPTPQSVDASGDSTQDTGKHYNNNNTNANNNGGVNPVPVTKPKTERRRTVSMRKMLDAREELLRRSATPDVKETIPPYEPLNFPLPGDTLDQMIQCMPTSYKDIIDNIINSCIDQVTGEKIPSTTTTVTTATTNESTSAPPTMLAANCKNRLTTQHYSDLSMLVEDSDETESVQEDANDPEWSFEPPQRIQKMQ